MLELSNLIKHNAVLTLLKTVRWRDAHQQSSRQQHHDRRAPGRSSGA
jgi:hypothetical protein